MSAPTTYVDFRPDLAEVDRRPRVESGARAMTVVARIQLYYRSSKAIEVNVFPPEAAFYKAGQGSGRVTGGKPDGGMAAMADRMGKKVAHATEVREISECFAVIPSHYLEVIAVTYDVPRYEEPRTVRRAAELAGLTTSTYSKRMAQALAWVQGRLCIPEVREDDE